MTTDWTSTKPAQIDYSYENFALAKAFVFRKWCEQANERQKLPPKDLSGSCKYGSLFMNQLFGGEIHGNYQHQYNIIDGRIVDLSHDALDVGKINNPYLHEPDFFKIPEKHASLNGCLPRVGHWVNQFLDELSITAKPIP